uniref:hypothetical protein n=1 Tax=Agathobacter sp. TaxID=2021311 RepID=UPI004056F7F0
MTQIKNKYEVIYCYVFVFVVIFQPVFLPFNILHIMSLMSIVILFKNKDDIESLLRREYICFLGLNLLFLFYSVIRLFINQNYVAIYASFLFVIEAQLCIFTAYLLCRKNNLEAVSVIENCAVVQALFAIVCLVFPFIQELVINLYVSNGFPIETTWFIGKRFFGLSSQLTYTMPIVQAVIAIIILKRCFEKGFSIQRLFSVAVLLLSSVINARTAFVVIGVGILYIIYEERKRLLQIPAKIYGIAVLVISIGCIICSMISPLTFSWIKEGLSEFIFIFTGKGDTPYFNDLLNNYLFFPKEFLELIFGQGVNVFNTLVDGRRSDVGYIIDIWLYGIIGCILKYAGTLYALRELIKKNKDAVFLILVLLICNIKGIAFENNELMSFISFFILIYGNQVSNNIGDNKVEQIS